jgi:hypothetical protein
LEVARRRRRRFAVEHRSQPLAKGARLTQLDVRTSASERLLEPLIVERLDEIIQRGELERLQRVLIVRGNKNCRRHRVDTDGTNNVEARRPGHLHVEEHEIRMQRANLLDRSIAIVRGANDLDSLLVRQKIFDTLPGERLVVDDEHA